MITRLLLIMLLAFTANGKDKLDVLIDALAQVESSGNPRAVNKDTGARGLLQILPCVIDDVNGIYGLDYTWQDAFDPNKSRIICRAYLKYYGLRICRNKGNVTHEDLARVWYGGPNAWSKCQDKKERRLKIYWRKVACILEKKSHTQIIW